MDDLAAHTERVIRTALAEQGGMGEAVSRARGDDDLYARGLTSLGSVRVMLVIEATLMIEFPEAWLNRELFATITNLSTACVRLMDPAAVAGHWGAQG